MDKELHFAANQVNKSIWAMQNIGIFSVRKIIKRIA
jgi:hypothetical protein